MHHIRLRVRRDAYTGIAWDALICAKSGSGLYHASGSSPARAIRAAQARSRIYKGLPVRYFNMRRVDR